MHLNAGLQASGAAQHEAGARRAADLSGSDGSGNNGGAGKAGGCATAAAAKQAAGEADGERDDSPSRDSASLYAPSLLQHLKRVCSFGMPGCILWSQCQLMQVLDSPGCVSIHGRFSVWLVFTLI